jgi:cell division protein FtsB
MKPQTSASEKLRYLQSLGAVSPVSAVPGVSSQPAQVAPRPKPLAPRPQRVAPPEAQADVAAPEAHIEAPSPSQLSQAAQNAAKARRLRYRPFRAQLMESGMMIAANAILATFAIVGLCKLLPYYQEQNQKLRVLEQEVSQTRRRVQQLQTKYQREQQPQTAGQIAREESNLIGADQSPVILVTPTRPPAPLSAQPSPAVSPQD